MPALIGALRVTLGVNTAQYEAGMRRASQTARRTGRDIGTSLQGAERVAVNAFKGIAAAAGIAGIGVATRGFLRYADAAKNLEAQLRLATRESGSFIRAQEDVRRIAATTRSGLQETANLYATFQRNSRELGISQEQAARATETVSKAFRVSGATSAEAAGGLRQFLQAIQSGTLRGEELNSVLENAPRLARLLADSLGVPIGQLRSMAEQGRLTSDVLLRALTDRRFTASLDEEFRQLPVTFDDAMTAITNAATVAFGAFDRGGEFTQMLTGFAETGKDSFDSIEAEAYATGAEIRAVFDGLSNLFDPIGASAEENFGIVRRLARDADNDIRAMIRAADDISSNYQRFGVPLTVAIRRRMNEDPNFAPPPGFVDRSRPYSSAAEQSRRARTENAGIIAAATAQLRPPARPGPVVRPSPTQRRGGRSGNPVDRLERERLQAARNEEAFNAQLSRVNDDLLSARRAIAVAADVVAEFERQEVEIERQRVSSSIQAEVTQRRYTQAQADQLIAISDQVAAERRRAIDLREAERVAEERLQIASAVLDTEMDLEQEAGNLARTAVARRASALRLLALQEEQERLALEAVRISQTATEAEKQIAEARLELLAGIYQQRREGVIRGTSSPLRQLVENLPTSADELNEAMENVAAGGIQSVIDGLADAAVGARSLGAVFKNVAQQIIGDLIRIQLRRAIVGTLSNALGGLFGGGLSSKSLSALAPVVTGSKLPGLATGGTIHVGGPAGVDRSLLSLNGEPVARVSRGETIGVGKRSSGSRDRLIIEPSPLFDVKLAEAEDRSAVRGAIGGRRLTIDTLNRKSRRRLG